jgi:hypothetical protein
MREGSGNIFDPYSYSTLVRFWPAEGLALLADGPTGCDEVVRGGCSYVWNLSVARPTVLTEAERNTRSYILLH